MSNNRSYRQNKNLDTIFGSGGDGCRVCGESTKNTRLRKYCCKKCRTVAYAVQNFYIWKSLRNRVFKRDNYTCQRCQEKKSDYELECDHIIPISKGGNILDPKNLQTLCKKCHAPKGTSTYNYRGTKHGVPSLQDFAASGKDEPGYIKVSYEDARRTKKLLDSTRDSIQSSIVEEHGEDVSQEVLDTVSNQFDNLEKVLLPKYRSKVLKYNEEHRIV